MTTPHLKSDDRSAQPIQGLSKRGQELVKPRLFGIYARARQSQERK